MKPKRQVFVCINERPVDHPLSCCARRGGWEVYEALRRAVAEAGLSRSVWVTRAGCMVGCHEGPTVVVYPDDVWYKGVGVTDVEELVREHLAGGRPVARLQS